VENNHGGEHDRKVVSALLLVDGLIADKGLSRKKEGIREIADSEEVFLGHPGNPATRPLSAEKILRASNDFLKTKDAEKVPERKGRRRSW